MDLLNHFLAGRDASGSGEERSTKRQKSEKELPTQDSTPNGGDTGPTTKTRIVQRAIARPTLKYGYQKNKALDESFGQSYSNEDSEQGNSSLDPSAVRDNNLIDSAYHSMTTTHDGPSDDEHMQGGHTPSRKGQKKSEGSRYAGSNTPQSAARARPIKNHSVSKGSTSSTKGILATPTKTRTKSKDVTSQELIVEAEPAIGQSDLADTVGSIEDAGDGHETSAPNTRSSGRARKKTWKQAAAELKPGGKGNSIKQHERPTPTKGISDGTTVVQEGIVKKSSKAVLQAAQSVENGPTVTVTPRKRGRPRKNPEQATPQKLPEPVVFPEICTERSVKGPPSNITNHEISKLSGDQEGYELTMNTPTKKKKRKVNETHHDIITTPVTESMDLNTCAPIIDGSAELSNLKSLLDESQYAEAFTKLKEEILLGLSGKKRLPLVGLDEEYHKVHQLVEQTIVAGEGNSMLVIGARGSAKSTLVESVLSQISEQHQEDFHVIRLNGFIHTDDKLALREIWRQLGKEMQVDDESTGARSNYADNLASLLAVLSHPTELSGQETNETSKSVIFVLDEFDLFASHPRQTLLYNLFDIAQSRKAPIAVLGLTTKIDAAEALEKRVKSRFSHRYVHLSYPKTYSTFLSICEAALHCKSTSTTSISSLVSTAPLSSLLANNHPTTRALLSAWSAYISATLTSPVLSPILLRLYHQTKSIPTFLSALIPALALSTRSSPPTATSIRTYLLSLRPPDSKLPLLNGLADLELALLIASARLDIILDTDTVNFNLAYDEYKRLAERARITGGAAGAAALGGVAGKVWGGDVALGAWERLGELTLLVPAGGGAVGGGGTGMDLGTMGRLWKVDVSLEEIGASRVEMAAGMAKWCREI